MELPKSRLNHKSHRKTIDDKPMIYEVVDEELFIAPSNNLKAFVSTNLDLKMDQSIFGSPTT
jgi:hypothetical protein